MGLVAQWIVVSVMITGAVTAIVYRLYRKRKMKRCAGCPLSDNCNRKI
ncbi:MAG: FeoB-associated Cys-rich membrane protein [Bacteroidales bacterium]|nr:FeoB-associated Cys-rich membrane protein [Bacteroidales bacterium]